MAPLTFRKRGAPVKSKDTSQFYSLDSLDYIP